MMHSPNDADGARPNPATASNEPMTQQISSPSPAASPETPPLDPRIDRKLRWTSGFGSRIVDETQLVLCEGASNFGMEPLPGAGQTKYDFATVVIRGTFLPQYHGRQGVLKVVWQGSHIETFPICSAGPAEFRFAVKSFMAPSRFSMNLSFDQSPSLFSGDFKQHDIDCLHIHEIEISESDDEIGTRRLIIDAAEHLSQKMDLGGHYLTPERQQYLQDLITQALVNSRPFSIIRLGDGEGRVLGYPDFFSDREVLTQVLYYHFGAPSINQLMNDRPADWIPYAMTTLKAMLVPSIQNADVIGLPISNFYREKSKAVYSGMLGYSCAMFYGLSYSRRLDERNYSGTNLFQIIAGRGEMFRDISQLAQRVHIVGPWDLTGELGGALGRDDLHHVEVPGHATWRGSGGQGQFPVLYKYVENKIIALGDLKGQLFFVGAGILGKYYCDLIKRRGGVALDIGSVFDSWAGRGIPYAVRNQAIQIDKLK